MADSPLDINAIWDISVMRDRLTEAEAWRDKYRMERDRYRTAWQSARSRAKAYGESIGRLCEERDTCLEWFREARETKSNHDQES